MGRRRSRRRVSAVRALGHNSSSPRPRHNASGKYTSPNRRERSTRTPFRRTGAANCPLLSLNSGASSGAPISRRASARLDPYPLVGLLRRRLLDHPPPNPNAAHQASIAVNFPVLRANYVWRKYMRHLNQFRLPIKYPWSSLHAQITLLRPLNT